MLSPKRTMSQLIQLWAKDPERAARLASSGLSSMWGIREFAAGGKVVPFISRGVRDEAGEPHVTIEVRSGFPAERSKISGEMLPPGLPYIKQVKGKGNSRPSEKYLPFVDDFIKTQGPWYKVEDIHHTGLRQRDQVFNPTEIKTLEGLGVSDIPDYLTREEIETLQKMFTQRKSSGGSVMDPTWHMMNMIYG